ncbi:unnamed protein product [Allacma fusca]|uniref:G-protein coupled receptors family 1 profile domain-containing protein n=1 Tax=Allacma fusca TaxID=39272 RepID=A0A8J2PZ89_9HEXA|nr:unnamed protein product [Allacma fusca]
MEDPNSFFDLNSALGNVTENETVTLVNSTTTKGTTWYMSSLGVLLIVPEWEAALTAVTLSLIIMLTLVGNVLVILSVFTYRPLRSAPNFFIVSLAVADMTVALLVLPLNVAYSILGRWVLGKIICEFWLTSDVLCCTASILHLCAIAVDRYRAITDPVNYARKRTLQRVLVTIAIVWIMSFLISSPPILGWNDWPAEFKEDTACTLTFEQGYVIYSALGSFYIPLIVMTAVYIRIFIATRRRLRQRAKASRLSAMARQRSFQGGTGKRNGSSGVGGGGGGGGGDGPERDRSSISSIENNGNDGSGDHCLQLQRSSENLSTSQAKKSRGAGAAGGGGGGGGGQERKAKSCASESAGVNRSDDNENARNSRGILKGRLQSQLTVDDYDSTKLSPANISEDSVTDAEVPLNQNKLQNHSNREGHSKCHPNRGSKKAGRQPSQQVSQFVEEKQRISLSKERKAARTLGIIMGVFVVCWLPFFLMYVILPFCSSCHQPSQKLVNFITWLGYVNSSLNPIIYTIFNMDFRKAFKKLLHIGR